MSDTAITTANQYLTFRLDNGRYAINVGRVREVLEHTNLTKIPGMPPYMEGVLNVRGSVLPVIDLRTKFGMEHLETQIDTAIVVTEIVRETETVVVGCKTDAVEEVIDIMPEAIEPPPSIGTEISSDFIYGIGKADDDFVIILDVERVFSDTEIGNLASVAPGAGQSAGEEAAK
ncbi:MAG: chemotaxis protein CheW [Spirochaeta sp.]|jgi:purine-binding chemotaxis protein CheW|nr:chemotaxis protein CheW [Spirochaeta sp.]